MEHKAPKIMLFILFTAGMLCAFAVMIHRITKKTESDAVSSAEPENPLAFFPHKKNTDELIAFDMEHALKYRGHITGPNSCALWAVSDHYKNDDDWSLTKTKTLELPDKFQGTDYVITELGDQEEPVFFSYDTDQICLETVFLPKQTEIIRENALAYYTAPQLTQVYINLSSLKSCSEDAFYYGSPLHDVYVYDEASDTYTDIETIADFEQCFGLLHTEFTAIPDGLDLFRLKDASQNGRLTFLNAICSTPFGSRLAHEYAKKIASENSFDAPRLSKQTLKTPVWKI